MPGTRDVKPPDRRWREPIGPRDAGLRRRRPPPQDRAAPPREAPAPGDGPGLDVQAVGLDDDEWVPTLGGMGVASAAGSVGREPHIEHRRRPDREII